MSTPHPPTPDSPPAARPVRLLLELECGSEQVREVVEVPRKVWDNMSADQREKFRLDECRRLIGENVQTFSRELSDNEVAPE